jgi:hypothetical protein
LIIDRESQTGTIIDLMQKRLQVECYSGISGISGKGNLNSRDGLPQVDVINALDKGQQLGL